MDLWAHLSPEPKRHLYRFIRFCRAHWRLTSVTDRQSDRFRYSVGNNRPHIRTKCCVICSAFIITSLQPTGTHRRHFRSRQTGQTVLKISHDRSFPTQFYNNAFVEEETDRHYQTPVYIYVGLRRCGLLLSNSNAYLCVLVMTSAGHAHRHRSYVQPTSMP